MSTEDLAARWAPTLSALPAPTPPLDDVDDTPPIQHTGVMVALFPTASEAASLALEDGEDPDELHITLAYLGQVGDDVSRDGEDSIIAAVHAWAATQNPIATNVNGTGFFNNDNPVTYATIDSAQLPAAREKLVQHLSTAGFEPNSEHGFTPHMTLAYADRREHNPPKIPMTFTSATVAFAGNRTVVPFGSRATAKEIVVSGPSIEKVHAAVASGFVVADRAVETDMNPVLVAEPETPDLTSKAFVTDINGRTLISGPATTIKASLRDPSVEDIASEHLLWMHGRFVGADVPNRNGALWSAGDLAMARGSVVNGPLNWLHEARHIIGTLAQADYVDGTSAPGTGGSGQGVQKAATLQPHITATAGIWKWIYPDEAFVVNQASELGQLWYSMECISQEISCAGPNGCGNTTSYSAYMAGAACEHVTQRASVRQFINPVFLGGAVIVPPTRPGWAEADASVMTQASRLAEAAFDQAGEPDITASNWEQMMAQLVRFTQQ